MLYTATEIAGIVVTRLAKEYPGAVFDSGPRAKFSRLNQQENNPGGRVIMSPGSISPGVSLFADPQVETGNFAEVWDFECFGYDASGTDDYLPHYDRAQRLADVIERAFLPHKARIKFASGKPLAPNQNYQVGAALLVSYVVNRPVPGWTDPATVSADGGTPDQNPLTLDEVTTSILARR